MALRDNWDLVKVDIMSDICYAKFHQNPELLELLLATGSKKLVEGNTWGDTFWGVCHGEGANMLGKILMAIRDREKKQEMI